MWRPLGVGYATFLGLLRLWVRWQLPARERRRGRDWPDLELDVDVSHPSAAPTFHGFGGGGEFAGAGSSGDFGPTHTPAGVGHVLRPEAGGAHVGDSLDLVGDLDEGAVVVLPVLAVVGIGVAVVAAVGTVWTAPSLLAEVFVDAALAAGVYRRLRQQSAQHWASGVVRRTWKAALGVGAVLVGVALVAQRLRPEVHSLGDLWR